MNPAKKRDSEGWPLVDSLKLNYTVVAEDFGYDKKSHPSKGGDASCQRRSKRKQTRKNCSV